MQQVISAMQGNMLFSFKIIGILWIIHIINRITHYNLNHLGLHTRSLKGLPGIVFAPFLHADFSHLFFNTIPLFVLSDLVLLDGKTVFYEVSLAIIILCGLLTWIFGKRGIHVGASGVIMGYFGYLLAKAYFQITATTIILAAVCLYYFGGLAFSIFPGAKKNVSWEGHLFGLLSGVFAAYYLPKYLLLWHQYF